MEMALMADGNGGGARPWCAPPRYRTSARQVTGMSVQLPLVSPNDAVAELQVQPAYQVSLASATAPTLAVVSKKPPSVAASTAVSAAYVAHLPNRAGRCGGSVEVVLVPRSKNVDGKASRLDR